jgi:hypothetical protein
LPGLHLRKPSGIKFCGECGAPLKSKFSSCGFENRAESSSAASAGNR